MSSNTILEIQGLGRVELDLSSTDWDRMTNGERQELVTRIAVDAGVVRPSQALGAAALSSVTDSLPAAVSGGLAALGRATGLTSDETNRALIDYASRQRAEAAASYQRDPTVADTVGQGWQQDGIRGAARSLVTQGAEGIGTAIPSVAATAGALALGAGTGGLAVPLIAGLAGTGLDATINASGQQQERIRQGQSPDLTPSDLGAIAGSSALNLIPGGRSAGVVGSALRMAGREGMENAAQEGLTMGSVAAQAPEGSPTPGVSDYADRISNAGVVGAATGGVLGGAGSASRRIAGGALDMAAGGGSRRNFVPEDPEVAQAERRVLQATQDASRVIEAQTGRAPDADEVIRTVREQQVREAHALIDAAHEAGEITSEVRNDVRRAIDDASSHTRRLYRTEADGTLVDGGLNVVDRVRVSNDRQTGMSEASHGALRRTLFDLEVASQSFKKGARIGPAQAAGETLGRVAGRVIAGGTGAFTAGPAGLLASAVPGPGGAGAAVGRAIGNRVDRMMGWQQPPVVRRAQAIAQRVKSDGTSTRDIQREADAARIRSAERRGEADAERTKIAQERASARALVQKARKDERATSLRERAADGVSGMVYRAERKAKAKARSLMPSNAPEASPVVDRAVARAVQKRDRVDRQEPRVVPDQPQALKPNPGAYYGPKPRISIRAEARAKARQAESITSGKPGEDGRPNASYPLLRAARRASQDAAADADAHGRTPSAPVVNQRSYDDAVDRARSARHALEADADRLNLPELRTAAVAISGVKDRAARRARAREAIEAVEALDSLQGTEKARVVEGLRTLGSTGGRHPAVVVAEARAKYRDRSPKPPSS